MALSILAEMVAARRKAQLAAPEGARPQKEHHRERDVCLGSAALVAHRTKVSRAFSPVPGDVGRADGHRPAGLLPERTPYVRRGDGQFRPDLPRSTLAAVLANWVMKAGRGQAPFAGKLIMSDLDPEAITSRASGGSTGFARGEAAVQLEFTVRLSERTLAPRSRRYR